MTAQGVWEYTARLLTDLVGIEPSDDLLFNNDAETHDSGTSYTIAKRIRVYRTGLYKVSFEIKADAAGRTAYGKIYRNGAALGAEHSIEDTVYTEFSDTNLLFEAGNACELYVKASTGKAYSKNLKLKGVASVTAGATEAV